MKTPLILFTIAAFLLNTLGYIPMVQAQEFKLPAPGVMVPLSPSFDPPILKGIKVHPENPFCFDFVLDRGDGSLKEQLKTESTKLIKYFLAGLTIPEQDLWVNLSPYEKDRIIPHSFGLTEMGRDLLAEDYMLKQITASLIYPEGEIGKIFWKRIYQEASRRYGTTNIPVNTFNKVWIVPQKAVVYENVKAGTAYVVEAKLRVMLEEDYLSMQKNAAGSINRTPTDILREIVIPELTLDVNEGKNFAPLRQVYNSLILATWYKKKMMDSILEQVYANKKKVAGVGYEDSATGNIEHIYHRYLQAFRKGVFNYIKEDVNPAIQETVPRKYFSGGMDLLLKPNEAMITVTKLPANEAMLHLNQSEILQVRFDQVINSKNHEMKASRVLEVFKEMQEQSPFDFKGNKNSSKLDPAMIHLKIEKKLKTMLGVENIENFLKFAGIKIEEITQIKSKIQPDQEEIRQMDIILKSRKMFRFFIKFKTYDFSIPQDAMENIFGPEFLKLNNHVFVKKNVPGVLLEKENTNLKNKTEALKLIDSLAFALGKMHGLGIVHYELTAWDTTDKGFKKEHVYIEKKTDGWVTRFIDYDEARRFQNLKNPAIDKETQDFIDASFNFVTKIDNQWGSSPIGPPWENPYFKKEFNDTFNAAYSRGFKKTKDKAMASGSKGHAYAAIPVLGADGRHYIFTLDSKGTQVLDQYQVLYDISVDGKDIGTIQMAYVIKDQSLRTKPRLEIIHLNGTNNKIFPSVIAWSGALAVFLDQIRIHLVKNPAVNVVTKNQEVLGQLAGMFGVIRYQLGDGSMEYILIPYVSKSGSGKFFTSFGHTQSIPSDKAMRAKGGINLAAINLKVDSRAGIRFHLDPAILSQLQNAPGFTPVIISIQPLNDLKSFLESL